LAFAAIGYISPSRYFPTRYIVVLAYEEDAKARKSAPVSARAAKSGALLTIAAIVVAALNLRPALAALGPVLDQVKAATGASSAAAC
jgi:CP family cyanate transporter-like MFS transporter